MTDVLEYCETLLETKHLEYKADLIPCTVQSTYLSPDGKEKNDILIKRELKLDSGQVIFGIEYDDKGNPAEAYTTDSEGKRVRLIAESMQNKGQNQTLPDLISERLETAKIKTKAKERTTKAPTQAKKVTPQRRSSQENVNSL